MDRSARSARLRIALLIASIAGIAVIGTLAGGTPRASSTTNPSPAPAPASSRPATAPAAPSSATSTSLATPSASFTSTAPRPATNKSGRNTAAGSTLNQPPTHANPGGGVGSTTTTTTTTTTAPTIAPGDIGVSGGRLVLNGEPYSFVGVNAYEIGTEFGVNPGCGGQESDAQLAQLFASLPANSLVRFWAFQDAIATNVQTDQLDWTPLDRVFAAAAAHGQRLIVTLTDQGGVCDGNHWQDPSWYEGGFEDVFNTPSNSDGSGHTPLSYWDYLQDVVQRYRNSPALGMWEPISEAEASTCGGSYYPSTCWGHNICVNEAAAAAALRHFFDVVGAEIHELDPNHLVENGLLGGGQCGTESGDYAYVSASPGVDVLSYHDYYAGTPMGGDQWNGIGVRIAQAAALGKPVIAGEMGLDAGTGQGCMTLAARANQIQSKIRAQMTAGASGVLIWNWLPAPSNPCTTDTFPGDPLMSVVASGPPSA